MFTTAAQTQIDSAMHRSQHACDAAALKQIAALVDLNHDRSVRRAELHRFEAEGRYPADSIAREMNENMVQAVDAERQIRDLKAGLFNEWAHEKVQETAALAIGAAATRTALRFKAHARRDRKLQSRKAAEKAIQAAKRADRSADAEKPAWIVAAKAADHAARSN
jgi:hypothetical protein